MRRERVVKEKPIQEGKGSVYDDLGYAASEHMAIKAEFVAEIAAIIKKRGLTQQEAAPGTDPTENLAAAQRAVSGRLRAPSAGLPYAPGTRHSDRGQRGAAQSGVGPLDPSRCLSKNGGLVAMSKTKASKAQRYRSPLLASVHETAKGLHDAGVMDRQTMRKFDVMCLTPAPPLTGEQIRQNPAKLRQLAEKALGEHRRGQTLPPDELL